MSFYSKKQVRLCCILLYCVLFLNNSIYAQIQKDALKVIIIRHGEKPQNGDNLNCQGLNRAQLLPSVIISKFGVPAFSYVPSLSADSATKHARMFQTITPLAVKYNLRINSKFNGKDSTELVKDILQKSGTVLIVWDHKSIVPIIHAFGLTDMNIKWENDDYDSIWIITFNKGIAILTVDKEGLTPSAICN
jgi:hypothetical protein